MKEQWQRIEELFHQAIELPQAERAAFLESQCGADQELKAQVMSLLESTTETDAIAEAVSSEAKDLLGEFVPGDQFGPYRILSVLGKGGMGTVYRASRSIEDAEQQVAIKLVQSHLRADEWAQRFRRERRILAGLTHPNIARLLDGGSIDGRPYLVMEYVEGLPIDVYCERNQLDQRQRIELIRQVCNAVSHAHAQLVVHRDIKPQNLLVSSDGQPKLLDFGIAKPLQEEEDDAITSASARLLTPHYAAPEQIMGKAITTATDIYALGTVLFKLLALKGPFERPELTGYTLEKAVCEQEAPRLGTLIATDKDIEVILAKALRKEPLERYTSVRELSEDLGRFLAGYPVEARKGNWSYRAVKLLRRRAGTVVAASLLGAAIVGGIVSTRIQQRKAEQRFAEVRELANRFLFEFHDSIVNLPGSTKARKMVVARGLEYLDRLQTESNDDPELQKELRDAYQKIRRIQYSQSEANLNDVEGAISSAKKAIDLSLKLFARQPNNSKSAGAVAQAYMDLHEVLMQTKGLKEAQPFLEEARRMAGIRAKLEPNPIHELRDEVAISGREAVMFQQAGLGDQAVASGRKVVAATEKLIALEPQKPRKIQLAHQSMRLGDSLCLTANRPLEAIPIYERARKLYGESRAQYPNDLEQRIDLAESTARIGLAYAVALRHTEALPYRRQALQMAQENAKLDPDNALTSRNLGVAYINAAQNEYKAGNRKEAVKLGREMVAVFEKLVAKSPDSAASQADYAASLEDLAEYLVRTEPKQEPYRLMRKAISIREGLNRKYPERGLLRSQLAHAYAAMGECHAIWNEMPQAQVEYEKALATYAQLESQKQLNGRDLTDRKQAQDSLDKIKQGRKPF